MNQGALLLRPKLQHFPKSFFLRHADIYTTHIQAEAEMCFDTDDGNERFIMRVVLPDLTVIYSTTLIMGLAQRGLCCCWIYFCYPELALGILAFSMLSLVH